MLITIHTIIMTIKEDIDTLSHGTYEEKKTFWDKCSYHTKHLIIFNVFVEKNDKVAETIIQFFFDDYDKTIHLRYQFINLLAITLATTSDPKYLHYVVRAKTMGDLFFYIDSNLLFEFNGIGKRATSMNDTIDMIDTLSDYLPDELKNTYKEWVYYYSKNCAKDLVIKQWLKYRTYLFLLETEDILNQISICNF